MPEPADQPAKPFRTWRPMILWTAGILLALATVAYFSRDLATFYVRNRIQKANTPAEEIEAFRLMNDWGHKLTPSYSVQAEDAQGQVVEPHKTGRYDLVAFVTITWWGNDLSVRRRISAPSSLSYIYGE